MSESQRYRFEPLVKSARPAFTQDVVLELNGKIVGHCRWHAPDTSDGLVQILDLFIDPLHQRQGHGSALLKQVYAQAMELFRACEIKPRRIWAVVEQKRQVTARAFFSRHGFHHVSTITNLYVKQEALVYQRSFD